MARPTAPGQRVRLTGQFLRSTGQFTGQDAHSTWTVREVRNVSDTLVLCVVDEPSAYDPSKNRVIHAANLYVVGTLDHRNA